MRAVRIIMPTKYSDGVDLSPKAKEAHDRFVKQSERINAERTALMEKIRILDEQFEAIKDENHRALVEAHPELSEKNFYICDGGHYHVEIDGETQTEIRQPEWAKELEKQFNEEDKTSE